MKSGAIYAHFDRQALPIFGWLMKSKCPDSGIARARDIALTLALTLRYIRRRPILAYAMAFLLIGFASLLQWQLQGQYAGAPFLTIYPAIILATLAGGSGPGIVSAILAGASQFGLFIPNFHWVAFSSYVFDAIVCVALIILINRTMENLWTNDVLTGLANRTLFNEHLERILKQSRRGNRTAILYLSLDRMKRVNETLGHPVGDKLIQDVANRLRGCVKDVDFVARLNGDEFALVQTRLEHISDAAELAVRASDAIRKPFRLEGHEVRVDVSVGISIAPDDGADLNELLRAADIALFEAKNAGGGTHRFYRPDMNKDLQRRSKLEQELQQALVNGEFELFYQPIVSLKDGRIKTFEALLRWRHPERGIISPSEFIPIAEETGFIVPVGDWVLRTACAEAIKWRDDISVAVNVSVVQLASRSLIDVIDVALKSAGLSPDRLTIEITESVLLESTSGNLETLKNISELGVSFSMDDFGAGYSSLTHLLSFPFTKIKVDQRFIVGLPDKLESRAVVRALSDLARELNIRVVAEGVENMEQMQEASILGCTDIQGYFISVPLPANQIRDLCWAYEVDTVEAKNRVA